MLDGGVNHLEIMPLSPITEPAEMDETLANVVAKFNANPVYRQSTFKWPLALMK
jgi:cytochrome c peroxidase